MKLSEIYNYEVRKLTLNSIHYGFVIESMVYFSIA